MYSLLYFLAILSVIPKMGKGRVGQFHNELYLRFLNPLETGGVNCDIVAMGSDLRRKEMEHQMERKMKDVEKACAAQKKIW